MTQMPGTSPFKRISGCEKRGVQQAALVAKLPKKIDETSAM